MRAIRKDKPKVPLAAALLFGLFVVSSLFFRREIVAGNIWAMGVCLGGMPREAAEGVIREKALAIRQGPITFAAGSRSIQVSSKELGLVLDESTMLRSLDGYVSYTPRVWPVFLAKIGSKKVMAAPVKVSLPEKSGVVSKIALALSKEGEGARYGFSGKDICVLAPKEGQKVTEEAVRASINGIAGTSVEVPFAVVPAPAGKELAPLKLVGEYSTSYDIKETDRNVNLSLAAKAVHGKTILPKEVFSFNREAGERTEEKGYRYANVVVGDHLEPGLAGGICQVTTTLFDAAALAGLDFPFVTAHGIPVDYVPPGMDAAVAWDYLDLKIENNTDGPVVFGAWVEDGKVTVRVFGKPSGRTYEIKPVVVREYPSPGKRPGLLVETYRIEKADGREVKKTLIMRSTYQPSYPPPAK